jgi:hypothetical protein
MRLEMLSAYLADALESTGRLALAQMVSRIKKGLCGTRSACLRRLLLDRCVTTLRVRSD